MSAPRWVLLTLLALFLQVAPGDVVYMRKARLSKVLALYDDEPMLAHFQVAVDPHGTEPRFPDMELRVVEASLYEDMCALFNLARRRREHPDRSKKEIKATYALERATVSAAFYFVEAYLNGIAFHYLAINGDKLEQSTKDYLSEWDSKNKRAKYLKTRDKLLHFPRLARGTAHPLLQENNCPELAFFLTKAKQLRDAIVHASPLPDATSMQFEKESALFELTPEEVGQVVDCAVTLVRRIETEVRGSELYLLWLKDRGADGFFPDSAFA